MVRLFLYPLSLLYGIIVFVRNLFYDFNILESKEFDVPIISVGNITVGGTGKTPHVEYLVSLLKDSFQVATLSRGYKRISKGFRLVESTSTVAEVGDEPLQIKRKFHSSTVAVCENRVQGVERLLHLPEGNSPDVIILDDAFQHRRIKPGLNILLIDYNRQLISDNLLPLGRLRESASQIHRANIIIFTKCPQDITPIQRRIIKKDITLRPYQDLFFTTVSYSRLFSVFPGEIENENFIFCKDDSVLIVTGIASPKPLHDYIEAQGCQVRKMVFPDHYNYSEKDIQAIISTFDEIKSERKIVLTTKKDALRFKELRNPFDKLKSILFYIPVRVNFLSGDDKQFNKRIIDYVGENKRNRELYKRKNTGTT